MIEFAYAYQPLFDIFLLNCGFAFSQYIVLRAGVFSLATAGLASIGGFATAILVVRHGVDPLVALPVATVTGCAAALLLSLPLARLRGVYQAIATLASVQVVLAVMLYAEDITGGAFGIANIPRWTSTWILLLVVAAIGVLLARFNATTLGATIDAVRQDESVAGSLGIDVSRIHILAFGISGALAGLFGGLESLYVSSIDPFHYGFNLVTAVLAFVVLGGRQSVFGPVVGALVMTVLPEVARPLADNRLLVNGAMLMLIIVFMPRGVVDGTLIRLRRHRLRSHMLVGSDATTSA